MIFVLRFLRNLFYFCLVGIVFGLFIAFIYAKKLEREYSLDSQDLGGALWSIPARVYARPLDIYQGAPLSLEALVDELRLLNYQEVDRITRVEQYHVKDGQLVYYAPSFVFWDDVRPARYVLVEFQGDRVKEVRNAQSGEAIAIERLNPMRIGSIYPNHGEDRLLLRLEEVPPVLIDTLLATEDRQFFNHFGIHPKGILRSVYVSFIAKGEVQGGSTITQQFIKNHYLSNERRISRKVKEMLMAVVLERHASKEQILEGYINEIYLGQDGQRAIHGFGLASKYFFNKDINDLNLHEIAMLVALVREPGSADPRKHPEHALRRRNLILRIMQEQGLISEEDEALASSLPLDIAPVELTRDRIRYPDFMDLVNQQLQENYSRSDLSQQGLNIFTTLDPLVQEKAQKAVSGELERLEKERNLAENFLQGASVIVDSATGEVAALVGSRVAGEQGFNRAISAKRPIGSLIKPVIYLAALEYPTRYNLGTIIDDSPLEYRDASGNLWSPKNYDRKNREHVMLIDALVRSYNIPTVRIALDIGLEDVVATLSRLGARDDIKPFPSLSLGSVDMSPLEVAQLYESFASGGFYQPLRAIREITTANGEIVRRYDMRSIRAIEDTPYFLILTAMQDVVSRGTATAAYRQLDRNLHLAGKTGTTDDYRDSWFVGFSGNYLTVAWVGNDQNQPTRLSGSAGGLPLWVAIMKELRLMPVENPKPSGIVYRTVGKDTGLLIGEGCSDEGVSLPYILGYEPRDYVDCFDFWEDTTPGNIFESEYFKSLPTESLQNSPFQNAPRQEQNTLPSWYN